MSQKERVFLLRPVNRLLSKPSEKTQGVALLLSLLISFIVALALSVELLNTRLEEKNIALSQEDDQIFYSVENQIETLMGVAKKENPCLVAAAGPNQYPQQLREKKQISCIKKEKEMVFYYVTEDLGNPHCLIIGDKKALQAAHFYRLNILGENTKKQDLILQVVYAVADKNNRQNCSPAELKIISSGRQSWRFFSG